MCKIYSTVVLKSLGLFIIISTLCFFSLRIEKKFWLYPSIDTKYSTGFSEQKFNSVLNSHSKDEVIRILGNPLVIDSLNIQDDSVKIIRYSYSMDGKCQWFDFAWKSYQILFDSNMIVFDKKAIWYND